MRTDEEKTDNRLLVAAAAILILLASAFSCFAAPEAPGSMTAVVSLSKEEKDYLARNPVVTIAMDTSWIPYAFSLRHADQVGGIIPNLLDTVAERVGLKVEYIKKESYAEAIAAARKGETMLVSGIAGDPGMARKNDLLITAPYVNIYYCAVTRGAVPNLYAKAASYRVAVCVGSYSTVAMKKKMPSYEFIEYHANEECMNAVNDGRADIALIANHAAEYYGVRHELANLKTVQISDFSWGLCFGVNKKCDPRLIGILNKGIASLSDNDTNQAVYSGLIDAAASNKKISDVIYSQPVLAVCVSGVIVALLLLIFFLIVIQRRKIAELKQRKLLQEDRDQKAVLLNSIPGGVGIFEIVNGEPRELYMNDSYYQLVADGRCERRARTGGVFLNGIDADGRASVRSAVQDILNGADQADFNYRAVRGDGEYVWIRMVASVVERKPERITIYCSFSGIGEVVAAQRALQENAAVLEIAMRSANMSAWDYDFKNHLISRNTLSIHRQAWGKIVENVPESLITGGCVHPDSAAAYRELYSAAAGGRTVQGDFLMRGPDSKDYWWERVILTPVYDETGALIKAIGTSIDVTEQKEKEEKYLRQLDLMSKMDADDLIAKGRHNLSRNTTLFFQGKAKGSLFIDESDKYDDAVEKLALTAASPAKGGEIRRQMDRGSLIRKFSQGVSEGNIEYKRLMADGTGIWTALKYFLFEEPDSGDVVVFIYSYDITERVVEGQIVSKLSNMEHDILGLLDVKTGRYVMKNMGPGLAGPSPAAEGDFSGLAGAVVSALALPADKERIAALFALENIMRRLAQKDDYYFTYSVAAGGRPVQWKKFQFCYLDDTKTTILYFQSDITDMYRKEQEQLRRTENALEEAKAANRAKTEFFARMSHDMRTPMNGILGLAAMSEDENDPRELKASIDKIKRSGTYLLGLINDSLDFQKIESGRMTIEPQIIESAALWEGIVEMVKQTADNKNITLRAVNKNVDLRRFIKTDPLRVKQIFVNLLSNAIKFTPEGGTVEFTFECAGRDGMISHHLLSVRDTGIGMSADFLKNGIFKPFSQESNDMTAQFAGSGLGLSIAKKLVEMMGGTIKVESALGSGTAFSVALDFELVDNSDVTNTIKAGSERLASIKAALSGKRILLVEDHPLNAEIAKKLLEKAGCRVTWEQDGRKGVDKFNSSPARHFDAVLMDIRMPVMDGLEAAKAIRALDKADAKTVPIIAVTANAYDEDVKLSFDAGMNEHLSKPIDTMKLYETLVKFTRKNDGGQPAEA